MLSDEELVALTEGRLELESLHGELRSRADAPRMLLEGVARIGQRERGGFVFTLYVRENTDDATMSELFRASPMSDRPVRVRDLLMLSVLDVKGRRWTCNHVETPSQARNYLQPGAVWQGNCAYLLSGAERFARPCRALRAIYPGNFVIPLNLHTKESREVGGVATHTVTSLSAWSTEHEDFMLQLVARGSYVEATLASKGNAMPPGAEERLTEALQFVLARPLRWSVAERYNDSLPAYQIQAVDSQQAHEVLPPIGRYAFEDADDVGRLLLAYLRCVMARPGSDWHPLSLDIRRVLLAASSSLDVLSLELGIAVESVLAREFETVAQSDETTVREVNGAIRALQELPGIDAIRERATSVVRGLLSIRAVDRLWALAGLGALQAEDVDAWKRLRHSAAHGAVGRDVDEQRRLVMRVYSLLLRLVFRVIGYSGRFTEYREMGWPKRNYPTGD